MKKVRSIFVAIALGVTLLSGLSLGMGSIAHMASSHQVGSARYALAMGKPTGSGANPDGQCPGYATDDC
ncbi:MAG TPA: hypothetical protein VFA09_21680 [Ktedonobacteraceae bacterium]|nr:hypothetical protein [Ktedonobacteraceae bacterium]